MRPREGHDIPIPISLRISPAGADKLAPGHFGNSIALASFSEPADLLEFSSEAIVFRRDHTSHRSLLDVLPRKVSVHYSSLEDPVASGYLQLVFRDGTALHDWTMQTFAPQLGDNAVHLLQRINEWIHGFIRYRRREDRGVQSP